MKDIIIAILCFPNDPTHNRVAHQMFIGEFGADYMNLYSVSSILGKERRVYGENADHYLIICEPESSENGFMVPSFIDCSKQYHVEIDGALHLERLKQRELSENLKRRILDKIEDMKSWNKHTTYFISLTDFRAWNRRL